MNLKSKGHGVIISIAALLLIWGLLTLLAQKEGPKKTWMIGPIKNDHKALIVFNPDLFYNLDEQVCLSFAEGLEQEKWSVKVVTVAAAKDIKSQSFELYVFCANTYNWSPDHPTKSYIKSLGNLHEKPVLAITLGSGSTNRSQRILNETILAQNGNLIGSKVFWLMRPNDEQVTNKSNTKIALGQARTYGVTIGREIKQQLQQASIY